MTDNWNDEYLPRLEKSVLYKELKSKCAEKDPDVLALVNSGVSYAVQRTKSVIKHMGEFTLHDGDHLFNVLNIMERLLTEANIKHLSIPELMLLILSAFFHDIGMSPDEKEVLSWKKIWNIEPVIPEDELETYNKFKRYYSARPDQDEIIGALISQGDVVNAEIIKAYLITDYIRQTHAEQAIEIIKSDWDSKIKFRDNDLTVEFAQICFSHNEDALSLLELDKNYLCGSGIVACLPLVAVILRLADILDFDGKRTPSILYSHLYVRHPISIKEWNKHRSVEAWEISPELIQYNVKCTHPAIEASIHEFCNLIDQELSVCNNLISNLNEFNKNRNLSLKIPFKVNREKIKTKTDLNNKPLYIYRETKFSLSKRQVIDLLMGTKLYGNPQVALRELIQNSIDACLLRKAQEEKWGNPYTPEITIRYYSEDGEDRLEVIDNGTGMDQYIIDNYYSKVGSSFYKSADFYTLKSESNADFTPNSRFGIGILSCFMVADTLLVDTRRVYAPHKSSEALNITVEGQESVFWIKTGTRETPGTTTQLILRKAKNPWDKMTEDAFIKSVEKVIINPPFKINIITNKQSKVRDEESFKEVTANSLKDYSWNEHENVKNLEFTLNEKDLGIIGSVVVGILVENDEPTASIDIHSKEIEIEGETFSLNKRLSLEENKIVQESTSITVNDERKITEATSTQHFASSKSRISLHGIEVPSTLYPDPWSIKNKQVELKWPFPLILVLDVTGNGDLDLNSSRTEIILTDKWISLEENLAYLICSQLIYSVSSEFWVKLKPILLSKTQNEQFISGLNRAVQPIE